MAPERLGVNISSGIGGIETMFKESEKLLTRGLAGCPPVHPHHDRQHGGRQCGHPLQSGRECVPVITACATSTHSVGGAYRLIRHGYLDAVITGGSGIGNAHRHRRLLALHGPVRGQ